MENIKDNKLIARQAIICCFISIVVFTTSFVSGSILGYSSELWALTYWGPALYFCLFNFVLRYCYRGFIYEVSIRSTFLGCTFATGLYLASFENGLRCFGVYVMFLSAFHFLEFIVVAMTNPKTLSIDSFILNHSKEYGMAAVASWIEFAVEYYFFPGIKTHFWISCIGIIMCLIGEILRKIAMFTAKTNFTHTIQFRKHPEHELVTHGVYAICRHPSYVGWFYWSIGTQIILLNPVCCVIYALASWMFFKERVLAEEMTLVAFFGNEYLNYQKKVSSGLPFINGYVVHDSEQVFRSAHWD